MNVWMQMHDLSSSDLPNASMDVACKVLTEFDWDSEILKEEQAASSCVESCPPGMGFVDDLGRILHIMPASCGRSHYHYQYPQTKKFLGFISVRNQVTVSVQHIPDENRMKILQHHFDGNQSGVLELLQAADPHGNPIVTGGNASVA